MPEEVQPKSVINRGSMVMHLRAGPNGEKRTLEPNKSIECLDEKEFKDLTSYKHIADVNKVAPQVAKHVDALRVQLAKAQAENVQLKAKASVTPELAPMAPKKTPKKKGR